MEIRRNAKGSRYLKCPNGKCARGAAKKPVASAKAGTNEPARGGIAPSQRRAVAGAVRRSFLTW